MADLSTVAHYIVFHPESKRHCLSIRAVALVGTERMDSWVGKVWVDRPPHNEDPFVLGPSWAYSYCHATQLQRKPTLGGKYVSKNSCILFCSGDLAERDILAVDTVFFVQEAHKWTPKKTPPKRYSRDVMQKTDLWKFHLRFGSQQGGHSGTYTYEGARYPKADGRYSRLPIGKDGERVRVRLGELSTHLSSRIKGKVHGKYPVMLTDQDLHEIMRLVDASTDVAVVGDIVFNDSCFTALRTDEVAVCKPCQPKAPAICG